MVLKQPIKTPRPPPLNTAITVTSTIYPLLWIPTFSLFAPPMATNLAVFNPVPIIRASSSSSSGKSDPTRRKAAAPKWWSPIFGWSSEPDYVGSSAAEHPVQNADSELDDGRAKSRFTLGCFTEEKAKLLRMKTLESSTFHDIMYHSAIASRLASDLSNRSKN